MASNSKKGLGTGLGALLGGVVVLSAIYNYNS